MCALHCLPVDLNSQAGRPAAQFLSRLGAAVAAGGSVSKAAFMVGAYAELVVALCRGNERVFLMFAFNYA